MSAAALLESSALTPARIATPISTLKLRPRAAHETIADIFSDPAIPKHAPVVCVVAGKPVLRADWHRVPPANENVEFLILPGNGGSSDILRLVATLALIVVSAAVAGPIGATLAGATGVAAFASSAGVALIQAGLVITGSFLINALLPPGSAGQGPAAASPSYSLTPQGNQARLGSPIPVGYGRRRITPDFAAPPYGEFVDNQHFIRGLLNRGLGEYQTEQIDIGKTVAWKDGALTGNFVAVEFELVEPGAVPTLYPAPTVTSAEVSGQELRNLRLTGSVQFTAADDTMFTNAPTPENANAALFTNLAPGDEITVTGTTSNNGTYTISEALDGGHTIYVAQALTDETANATIQTVNWVGPYAVTGPKYVCDEIAVDFVFPKGLYYADDKGKLQKLSVAVAVEARKIDSACEPIGDWVRLGNLTYTKGDNAAQRFTEKFSVEPARYEVRCQRTTPKSYDARYASDVQWAGLKGRIPFSGVYGRGDVSLLAYRMRATNQLSVQSSREISIVQTRKLPIWDGTNWSAPVPTRSIAWAAADMKRNTAYSVGMADEDIDLAKLAQLDAAWTARGDTADGVFDQVETLWDGLCELLKAGRAQPIMVGGKVTYYRDEPRALPKGFFSPRNCLKGSFSTTAIFHDEKTPDDVIFEFWDERTWSRNEVRCTLPGSASERPARMTNRFIANRPQAWREGIYNAAANAYRRQFAGLSTEMEGRLLLRGDQAVIAHDVPQWNEAGDVRAIDGRTLTLSEPVTWGPLNYILLRGTRNQPWGPVKVTRGATDDEAVLDEEGLADAEEEHGQLVAVYDANGDLVEPGVIGNDLTNRPVHFQFGDAETAFRKFLLLTGKALGQEQVQLSFVNDDERVYAADVGDPPAESDGIVTPPDAPAAPATLTLEFVSGTDPVTIRATWSVVSGAVSYRVETGSDGVHWGAPLSVTALTTELTVPAGPVHVRVAAVA